MADILAFIGHSTSDIPPCVYVAELSIATASQPTFMFHAKRTAFEAWAAGVSPMVVRYRRLPRLLSGMISLYHHT